jgi:hypothetical protein
MGVQQQVELHHIYYLPYLVKQVRASVAQALDASRKNRDIMRP